MKRTASDKRKGEESEDLRRQRSVKWDEANLEENDKIKAELNPTKISEPKTPYHGPMDSEEELDLGEAGMAPLTLEDEAAIQEINGHATAASASASAHSNGGTSVAEEREDASNTCWSDSDRAEHSSGGVSGASNGVDEGDDEQSSRKRQEKKRRFEARRRQHYNMRDALRRGKELLSHEPNPLQANGLSHHERRR